MNKYISFFLVSAVSLLVGCDKQQSSENIKYTNITFPYLSDCRETIQRFQYLSNSSDRYIIEIKEFDRRSLPHDAVLGYVSVSLTNSEGLLVSEEHYMESLMTGIFEECMPTIRTKVLEVSGLDKKARAYPNIEDGKLHLYENLNSYRVPDSLFQ